MNWIDLAVYIIIFVFVAIGMTRGLVKQVFSIAALIGGAIIGLIFYDVFAEMFINDNLVNNESIANVGAFLIVGFISYILIQFLGWITTKLIGSLHLGWLNRFGGAAVGLVIGLIAAFLFISTVTLIVSDKDPVVSNSTTIPYLNTGYQKVKSKMPENLRESFNRSRELIREEGLKAAMRIKDSKKFQEILNDQ